MSAKNTVLLPCVNHKCDDAGSDKLPQIFIQKSLLDSRATVDTNTKKSFPGLAWALQCALCFAGHVEEGVVSLYGEDVGMWEYNLTGVGLKPGVMDPTHISATLGSDGSSFVSWRNPFEDPVKVSPTACCFCCCCSCC